MDDVAKLMSTLCLPRSVQDVRFRCHPLVSATRHGYGEVWSTWYNGYIVNLDGEDSTYLSVIDDSEDERDRTSSKREWTLRH
jgi:hypothetical protein